MAYMRDSTGRRLDAFEVAARTDVLALQNRGSIVLDNGTVVPLADLTRPGLPVATIDFRGDSITYSNGGVYPNRVAARLGATVVNNGVSGYTSTDIAIRKGGIVPLVTLPGNAIPTGTGATTLSKLNPSGDYRSAGSGLTFQHVGTLAGVPGVLEWLPASQTWTFTRSTAGSAVPCPPRTPFLLTTPFNSDAPTVVMLGRNNFLTTATSLTNVQRDITAIVNSLTPYNKQLLVLGMLNASDEVSGSANYTAVTALNTALASAFGSNFFDPRPQFIRTGLARAGVAPTAADTTAIGKDAPPPSIIAAGDTIHPTNAGYVALADIVAEKIAKMGWGYSLSTVATTYFADNFTRADASTLGGTSTGGLPWAQFGGPGTVGIASNQGITYGSAADYYSVVDVGRSDGVYRATLANAGTSPQDPSLVFRFTDLNNWLGIRRVSSGSLVWRLVNTVAGVGTNLYASSVPITDSTTFAVTLNGTAVSLAINGTTVWTGTCTDNVNSTRFGIGGGVNSGTARWSSVSLQSA